MEYGDERTITPFDPERGLRFKVGRIYLDQEREVREFEERLGFKLPEDFLGMIGEYCAGGPDGDYRVYCEDGVDIVWSELLLVKVADAAYRRYLEELQELMGTGARLPNCDTIAIIEGSPGDFGRLGALRLFPFGRADLWRTPEDYTRGYLAFDVARGTRVVFVSVDGSCRIEIARSFREMMVGASVLFYG
jgi:hypothetical protein